MPQPYRLVAFSIDDRCLSVRLFCENTNISKTQ